MNILSWQELSAAGELRQHQGYLDLLERLRESLGETSREALRPLLESDVDEERATAFLACAAWHWKPEDELIKSAFQSDSSIVLAAAALCLATCCAEEEALCRGLLLGRDPWTRSEVSRDAHYYLIGAMGISGEGLWAGLLLEALQHPHFCYGPAVAEALERLSVQIDEEQVPFRRSISVDEGLGGILIGNDERYGGGSNCVDCRFFPCRVNLYYSGGIEDCSLWNKVDPKSLDEIIDQRPWGDHHEVEFLERRPPDALLAEAQDLLRRGEGLAAIPPLCEILIDSELQSALQPVVWINLARCFSLFGEPHLAFIALKEGARNPNLIGLCHREEREEISRFVDDPEKVFGRPFPADRRRRFSLRAGEYKRWNLYTQAADCYAMAAFCEGGTSGGLWFEIGECLRELGEIWLAELFFRKGAALARYDIGLREKFLQAADAVRVERPQTDPGLALERRRADRAKSDPPTLCLIDPVEEPDGLTGGRPWWQDRGQGWIQRDTGSFFEESKGHYLGGDIATAIEVLEWGKRFSLESGPGGRVTEIFDEMIQQLREE